jgi:glycosyltransferase involved in cell wall biosynthesis
MKKISVILTTYNGSKTIERTLNSIFNQNGLTVDFNLEVLVIDDQSTDNTTSIVEKFPVKLLVNEVNSGGPNKGRNLGLSLVTGDYICIVDQDDEWLPNRISIVLPYLNQSMIISSGFIVKDTLTGVVKEIVNEASTDFVLFDKNTTFMQRLEKSNKGQNTYLGSLIYHASLKHVLFEEDFGMVDFDWLLKIFHEQSSLEICKPLYTRYLDGKNLSMNEKYRKNDYTFSIKTIETYKNAYPKQSKSAVKKVNGTLARYYYVTGNMKLARVYFKKSTINLKTILYVITSFVGSKFIIKKFSVFGN